jgi:hypothetical protein
MTLQAVESATPAPPRLEFMKSFEREELGEDLVCIFAYL